MAIKFNLPSYDYDVLKTQRKNVQALRNEYSRLRSIARKRLERMEKTVFSQTQTYLPMTLNFSLP